MALRGPTRLDFALAALVFLVTALPYLNSLHGNFCYDDKVAVGGNPDVVLPNVTLWDIATHDFWGNDILRRRCVCRLAAGRGAHGAGARLGTARSIDAGATR